MPSDLSPVSRELRLLEQVHVALGSAQKLDDFYTILAGLIVGPDSFDFSRTFIIRYDEKLNQFHGRMALGAQSADEHHLFRKDLQQEQDELGRQIKAIELQSAEPAAIQQLYDLRFHGLWVQLLQGREEGTALNHKFQQFHARGDELPDNHILKILAKSPRTLLFKPGEADISGLESIIQSPVVAARLMTRRGLHGIIIADRKFGDRQLDQLTLVRFQWLITHASVTLDNVELVEELTEAAQRMREVDRLKTNFLSIVSHELRTPLTSIVGFVHLLKEGKSGEVNPQQRDLLDRVANHSAHLQNMVNDILEIAEVESGGIVNVVPQAVDPLAALWNVIPKVESRRSTRQVTIEPVVHEPVPQVITDPTALERIYYHLLDNAIKFIPVMGLVRIEFERVQRRLDITISDTGIGISPENLKQIFDHFYQIDYRLERAYGGMGIGLTVVKLLLDATGGTLNIESKPGEGSRFTISFPLA
jgi:signal transduction histidine kinase